MRRLARYLLTAGWITSLILCLGVCALWVRCQSGMHYAQWTYDRWMSDGSARGDAINVTCDRLRIWVMLIRGHVPPRGGGVNHGYYLNADATGGRPVLQVYYRPWARAPAYSHEILDMSGLGPLRWRGGGAYHSRNLTVGISYWLLAAIFALPPAFAAYRFRARRRRRRSGLCPICGYDLRATPDRCPECGRVAATSANVLS